jgi:aryl-alcohol dehydrogenase-like predicted oxidoreductase
MLGGYATSEGTSNYASQFADDLDEDHFTESGNLHHASIGLGSYLGEPTEKADRAYQQATTKVVNRGINVIDTAVNYRYQRIERAIGKALENLITGDGDVERNQLIVSTKGGYVPFDGDQPEEPRDYVMENYVNPGIVEPDDLVNGSHCITASYLDHELQQSRENLGLETIDRYYIHNPETQLPALGEEDFYTRLSEAFEAMERAVERNQIRHYGLATWNGFRVPPDHEEYLDLNRIVDRAESVGGTDHHFRAVQLPYNLAMTEALTRPTQTVGETSVSFLEAAHEHELTVTTSATLMQGSLTDQLPVELRESMENLETDPQRAIQFARSAPGVTTALIGMKTREHIDENLGVGAQPRIPTDRYMKSFFTRK